MTITARSIARRRARTPVMKGRFEDPAVQKVRGAMTNWEATKWAEMGFQDIFEFADAAIRRLCIRIRGDLYARHSDAVKWARKGCPG